MYGCVLIVVLSNEDNDLIENLDGCEGLLVTVKGLGSVQRYIIYDTVHDAEGSPGDSTGYSVMVVKVRTRRGQEETR